MENIEQFEQKIKKQTELLNNFLNSLKENNPELKDAYIYVYNGRTLQCFEMIVPCYNGIYLHGSNRFTYEQMNCFFIGYMRKQENINILNDNNKVTF